MRGKSPFKDPVEGPNAHKEEECPGGVEGHYWCIRINGWIYNVGYDDVSHDSAYNTEYNARNYAWNKLLKKTCAFDFSHGCPPWLVIHESNAEVLTTCTDDQIGRAHV